MSSTYVSVEFRDISDQDAMIEQVKLSLMDLYKQDGEKAMARDWHDPKPQTWQEAFVRENSIDYISWEDYEGGDNSDIPNWNYLVENYAEEKAEEKLYDAFHHLEVEVEL